MNISSKKIKNIPKEFKGLLTKHAFSNIYLINNKDLYDNAVIDVSSIKNNSLIIFENIKNKSFFEKPIFSKKEATINYIFKNCQEIFFVRDFDKPFNALKNNFYFYNSVIYLSNIFSSEIKYLQENFLKSKSTINQNDISLLSKESKAMISIKNNHLSKKTISNTTIKNILKDSSFLKYDGLINILKEADFSNSYLETNTMLLSNNARAINIPMLEIVPKNVKATHSATIEHVTQEQIFYLSSRAISKKDAYTLMVSSFLKSYVSNYPEKIIKYFDDKINENL